MADILPYKYRYFSNYPVVNAQQALWFSKELTLPMIDLLWRAGPRGLTPLEVMEHLKKGKRRIGKSIVYQTLRGLYEQEIVEREWDNAAKAHRSVMKDDWMPAELNDEYEVWVDEHFGDLAEEILFPAFLRFLEEATKLAKSKRSKGEFMPTEGETSWCKECGYSHQAGFFFLSLLWYASDRFAHFDTRDFKNEDLGNSIQRFYERLGYADPDRDGENGSSD